VKVEGPKRTSNEETPFVMTKLGICLVSALIACCGILFLQSREQRRKINEGVDRAKQLEKAARQWAAEADMLKAAASEWEALAKKASANRSHLFYLRSVQGRHGRKRLRQTYQCTAADIGSRRLLSQGLNTRPASIAAVRP
jgi:hypothetical protein